MNTKSYWSNAVLAEVVPVQTSRPSTTIIDRPTAIRITIATATLTTAATIIQVGTIRRITSIVGTFIPTNNRPIRTEVLFIQISNRFTETLSLFT